MRARRPFPAPTEPAIERGAGGAGVRGTRRRRRGSPRPGVLGFVCSNDRAAALPPPRRIPPPGFHSSAAAAGRAGPIHMCLRGFSAHESAAGPYVHAYGGSHGRGFFYSRNVQDHEEIRT